MKHYWVLILQFPTGTNPGGIRRTGWLKRVYSNANACAGERGA